MQPIREREREPVCGKTGAFTKPAGPVCETVEAAVEAVKDQKYTGDVLVRRVATERRTGWQAWFKRATARGANHLRDYDWNCGGGDRRARMHRAGAGRVFVENLQ